jgi:hypothetical protein
MRFGRLRLQDFPLFGRAGFAALAVLVAGIGASSLNPRELYNEMYPVEAMKRDAFHICHATDPTFVRAVRGDREACFDAMPNVIAIALGRVRPTAALAIAALLDPSRQAELLLTLASMPPRQPITVPRSFVNTAWTRALSSGCGDKTGASPSGPAVAIGNARTATLDNTVRGNLPPLPRADRAGLMWQEPLPVIPLVGAGASGHDAADQLVAGTSEPTVVDLGDKGPPAIVPLAPPGSCGGA